MKILAVAVLSFAGLSLARAQPAAADTAPSPRDQHAAECVAALEVATESMAAQVKAGQDNMRGPLLDRLIAGTAFVGDTYLHGNSDEQQARALANRALEAQKRLPAPELAARQAACAAEGTRLYDDSNGLEKAVVRRLAKKRMDKLLGA